MRTPAGKECRFYYEDFNRGRHRQECRLIVSSTKSRWRPDDCKRCVVPEILWANASDTLQLTARINQGVLGVGRHIDVRAECTKHECIIEDPYIGCQHCADEKPNPANWVNPDQETP